MIKIAFLCRWGDTSKQLLDQYKKATSDSSGVWGNIQGVEHPSEADYFIVLDDPPNKFDLRAINPDRVICFPREPPCIRSKKYYTTLNLKHGYTYKTFYHVVPQFNFLGKTFNQLRDLKYEDLKKEGVSCVVSSKRHTYGAIQRLATVDKMIKKFPKLDLYGRGLPYKGGSYKGAVKYKYTALASYNYSLCFENCSIDNYFSEKFTDSILLWTIPIYWGCRNIEDYFPKDSYYYVDITKPGVIDKIINIVTQEVTEKNIKALVEARKRILYTYNIWPTISRLI